MSFLKGASSRELTSSSQLRLEELANLRIKNEVPLGERKAWAWAWAERSLTPAERSAQEDRRLHAGQVLARVR